MNLINFFLSFIAYFSSLGVFGFNFKHSTGKISAPQKPQFKSTQTRNVHSIKPKVQRLKFGNNDEATVTSFKSNSRTQTILKPKEVTSMCFEPNICFDILF
jgi:hypothetical protein